MKLLINYQSKMLGEGEIPSLSSNQYDQIKQAMEMIKHKSTSGAGGNDQMMRQMMALAMKNPEGGPNIPPEIVNRVVPPPQFQRPPLTPQVEEKVAKTRLVKQMRLTLQNKYHIMYYMKPRAPINYNSHRIFSFFEIFDVLRI